MSLLESVPQELRLVEFKYLQAKLIKILENKNFFYYIYDVYKIKEKIYDNKVIEYYYRQIIIREKSSDDATLQASRREIIDILKYINKHNRIK